MRPISAFLVISALVVPQPVLAQFSVLGDAARGAGSAQGDTSKGCDTSKKSSARMFGSMLGGLASRTVGRSGIGSFLPLPEVASILTDVIACKLEPKEQKQAAAATEVATRGGAVGSSSSWTSETRPGVAGKSTVASRTQTADGTVCMTVNDVIIVSGEETTVAKKMCRAPGASGYTLSA